MIRIISFRYGHGAAPTADLTYDLRALLRNPHHDPALCHMTGLDQAVYDHVMATDGAERLAFNAVATARGLAQDTGADVTVAFGCTGGRHRSVGLARRAHELLSTVGDASTIEHRDVGEGLLPPGIHSGARHGEREDGRQASEKLAELQSDNELMRSALDELWVRIDDAGSLMSTRYVADAIKSTRRQENGG